MSILLSIAILIALFLFARWFAGFGVGAPYLPVRKRDIEDAFSLVMITPQDVVVDLGSGDGRLLVAAAEKGATVIGYEINPFLVWVARWRLRRFGSRARVHRQNLLQADMSQATVVFIFGIANLMPKIGEMIERQTHSFSIVSFAFEVPGQAVFSQRGIVKCYKIAKK